MAHRWLVLAFLAAWIMAPAGAARGDSQRRTPSARPARLSEPQESAFVAIASPAGSRIESVLPLREALRLALRNNLDVQLARLEPELASVRVTDARGAFDPVVSLGSGFAREEGASSSSPGAQPREAWSQNAGVEGVTPIGLRYSSTYAANHEHGSAESSVFGDGSAGGFRAQLSLPLLRDFRMNEARIRVVRGELGQRISREALSSRLTELVAQVENLYWDLAAARAEVNVAARSLQTARGLLEQTRAQEELGFAARLTVSQAEAGVAEREVGMIGAGNRASVAKDRLLSAVLAPDVATFIDRDFTPEIPTFARYPVRLEQAIQTALQNRPDLAEARGRVEGAKAEKSFAQNGMRPRLDLTASYAVDRAAGVRARSRRFSTEASRRAEALPSADATDAATRAFALDLEDARKRRELSFGARFEVPLGNRTARAVAEQRSIEIRRARTELRRMEQTVILGVREAVGALESADKAVDAAQRRRAAAAQVLRGERERLALGESTPLELLRADEQVSDAERQLIGALRDHRNAITRVEQVQGRLLEVRGVDVKDLLQP